MGGRTGRGKRRFETLGDFNEWLDQVGAQRFDRRASFEAGQWAALLDAIEDARHQDRRRRAQTPAPDDNVEVPRWALTALTDILRTHLDTVKSRTGKGRLARWRQQYRQDRIDWERYGQVWARHIATYYEDPRRPKDKRRQRHEHQQIKKDTPYVVDVGSPYPWSLARDPDDWSVFKAVSKNYSPRTACAGAPATIRGSWERVTKALAQAEAWRYYPSKWVRVAGLGRHAEEDLPK